MITTDNLIVQGEEAKIVKKRLGYKPANSCANCASSNVRENSAAERETFCTKSFGFHFFTTSSNTCDFHKPFDNTNETV